MYFFYNNLQTLQQTLCKHFQRQCMVPAPGGGLCIFTTFSHQRMMNHITYYHGHLIPCQVMQCRALDGTIRKFINLDKLSRLV